MVARSRARDARWRSRFEAPLDSGRAVTPKVMADRAAGWVAAASSQMSAVQVASSESAWQACAMAWGSQALISAWDAAAVPACLQNQ